MRIGLTVESISVSYGERERGGREVVQGLSFAVTCGEALSILGPSGCGKTTLLNVIAGLQRPTQGGVAFPGAIARPRIGYMFQESVFLPWRNNLENVKLGLEFNGKDKERQTAVARDLLASIGLAEFGGLFPHESSGGMQRKLGLARALAIEPDLILLDEPFSNLDFISRGELEGLVHSRVRMRGITSILVTHQIDEALAFSDTILLVSGGPMRVARKVVLSEEFRGGSPEERRGCEEFSVLYREVWRYLRSIILESR